MTIKTCQSVTDTNQEVTERTERFKLGLRCWQGSWLSHFMMKSLPHSCCHYGKCLVANTSNHCSLQTRCSGDSLATLHVWLVTVGLSLTYVPSVHLNSWLQLF